MLGVISPEFFTTKNGLMPSLFIPLLVVFTSVIVGLLLSSKLEPTSKVAALKMRCQSLPGLLNLLPY
jgi:hypothetical protein